MKYALKQHANERQRFNRICKITYERVSKNESRCEINKEVFVRDIRKNFACLRDFLIASCEMNKLMRHFNNHKRSFF